MGYIKVAHREMLRQIDNYSSLPKGWDKFVDQQAKYHNLVIKSKKISAIVLIVKILLLAKIKLIKKSNVLIAITNI